MQNLKTKGVMRDSKLCRNVKAITCRAAWDSNICKCAKLRQQKR